MSGRTRNMAADAAHLAGLGAGPSGSASGHRAHRRLRAEQGRAASGALNGRAFGLGAAQVGLTLSLPQTHERTFWSKASGHVRGRENETGAAFERATRPRAVSRRS